MSTLNNTDSTLDEMVEQMLNAVLGERQVGYMPDMKRVWNRSGQTIWRYYRKSKVISDPTHVAGQRAWPRPVMKADLKRAMANDKQALGQS